MLIFRILVLASMVPMLALCGCGEEDLKARDIRLPRWKDRPPDVSIKVYHSGRLTLGLNDVSRRAFVGTFLQAEMKPVPKDKLTALPSLFVEIDGVCMSYLGPLWDERKHVYYTNESFGWLGDLSHILRIHDYDIHNEEILAAFNKYGIVLMEDKRPSASR